MASPEIRHQPADRAFHWIMAILVLLLLGTAFLPILGIKFDWLPTHWISGVLLIAATLFHFWRVFAVHGIGEMIPRPGDFTPAALMSETADGKYTASQKLYHLGISVIMLVLLGTGGLMLARIDTSFWNRNPAILSDQDWGIVYTLHGGASLFLIFMFILHIYFAFLPEHRKLLAAMALGRPVQEEPPANKEKTDG